MGVSSQGPQRNAPQTSLQQKGGEGRWQKEGRMAQKGREGRWQGKGIWRRSVKTLQTCAANGHYEAYSGAGPAPILRPAPSRSRPAPKDTHLRRQKGCMVVFRFRSPAEYQGALVAARVERAVFAPLAFPLRKTGPKMGSVRQRRRRLSRFRGRGSGI